MKVKLDSLDALFSEFIRKRAILNVGGCERCLTPKYDIQRDDGTIFPAWKELQCAHFHGRTKASVRFDESNAIGICGACHIYFHSHPLEHVEWFKQKLGEQAFDLLNARARTLARYLDKELIRLYLQEKIKEVMV